MSRQWEVEHSCECRDCCYLRCPRPCPCTPCCCPRNPVCAHDKQPKIVGSMIGYFKILRPQKDDCEWSTDESLSNGSDNCRQDTRSVDCGDIYPDPKSKDWTGKGMYNECRNQRDYKLRFTSNGVYGRGYNNLYGLLSPCRCGTKGCDCNCDLYCTCSNDKY